MAFDVYDASVPAFLRGLAVVDHLLDKAETSALDEADIMAARLAPDMHPFPNQVRMAAFSARGATARLAGVEWPRTSDDEGSIGELRETVRLSRDFVASIDRKALAGAEDRPVQLKLPSMELNFTGEGYLTSFALPNFYFHVSMAYAILRHRGVELGKRDYLGQVSLA